MERAVPDTGDQVVEVTGVQQRRAWEDRVLPPVEQVRPDLWSIPVPIPDNPLRYVSVYAFAGDSGLTLIDAGWGSDASWSALTAGLAGIGAEVADVQGVLVTHMHFDHSGLAARVREGSGAWVAMHRADQEILARSDYRDAELAVVAQTRWLATLGATTAEARSGAGTPADFAQFTSIALADRFIENGDPIDVPGWSLRAVHTPGHTPGHLCFIETRAGLLFSGDHVLPRISPNISPERAGAADPLGDYLCSLAKVRALPVQEVLPGHEWRFRGLAARADQIIEHHRHRLDELLTAARERPASTPWELAGHLSWSRPWDQYDGQMRVFAVTETLAHLRHLVHRGSMAVTGDGVLRYTAVGDPGGSGII